MILTRRKSDEFLGKEEIEEYGVLIGYQWCLTRTTSYWVKLEGIVQLCHLAANVDMTVI